MARPSCWAAVALAVVLLASTSCSAQSSVMAAREGGGAVAGSGQGGTELKSILEKVAVNNEVGGPTGSDMVHTHGARMACAGAQRRGGCDCRVKAVTRSPRPTQKNDCSVD